MAFDRIDRRELQTIPSAATFIPQVDSCGLAKNEQGNFGDFISYKRKDGHAFAEVQRGSRSHRLVGR